MERAESQGHRLSSYASSSSTKHSPKTPKKSTEKLSTHSSIKDESLSPHHLLSAGYSYTSINSQQSKDNHQQQHLGCTLRCTCANSNYNSLKSIKSSSGVAGDSEITTTSGDKSIKHVKTSCDAATSPSRFSHKSPQLNMRSVNQKSPITTTKSITTTISKSKTASNELRLNDVRKIVNKPSPSPRRLIATRNAATSPSLDIRKLTTAKKCFEILPSKSPDVSIKTILEKSNSLGESQQSNRQLRTTRSLSPRPPVRHQHAIMVSDENDVVSVKVSPNDDFEIDREEKKVIDDFSNNIPENTTNSMGGTIKHKHKAQSEQTSPNLGDFDASFSYEKSSNNNKSTGCLVYIPSDPWLKMSDVDDIKKLPIEYPSRRKFSKLTQETRSLSRGDLPISDNGTIAGVNDPWVWRKSSDGGGSSPRNIIKKSPKQEIYRKAKSFSATKFEISDTGKLISFPLSDNTENSAKLTSSSMTRPKLQRCKSPLIIDDDFLTFPASSIDPKKSCTCTNNSNSNLVACGIESSFSNHHHHQQQNLSSPGKHNTNNLTIEKLSTSNNLTVQQNKSLLHVINPNLMQSRHSFSSVSQKDDELQLNIRRLSEQIKHTNSTGNNETFVSSGADFTDYINQFKITEAKKTKTKNSTKKDADPVLETTC